MLKRAWAALIGHNGPAATGKRGKQMAILIFTMGFLIAACGLALILGV